MPKKTFLNLPEEKRQQILQEAQKIFAENAYEDVSINSIIKQLQIPTGSFYQYFQDKKDLYFYIMSIYLTNAKTESTQTGKKINLLNPEIPKVGMSTFEKTAMMPHFREIFIESFNKTPDNLRRDWAFERLMSNEYVGIYDQSIFGDTLGEEIKKVMISMAVAVPSVVRQHQTREDDGEKYTLLYETCMEVLYQGLLAKGLLKNIQQEKT